MDKQIQSLAPDYKKIYVDIILSKFPDKMSHCKRILDKHNLSGLDVITLNSIIFGCTDKATEIFNQKHRSYKKCDILRILDYQKQHNLNNTQLSRHFKLSKNTITSWKKKFY